MDTLDEGWVHSLRSWASLTGQLHESFCALMSSMLSYFCLESVKQTRAWCDHKVWFAYSPPTVPSMYPKISWERSFFPREPHRSGWCVCVPPICSFVRPSNHLFFAGQLLLTRGRLVSLYPCLFNIQLLEKLPGVLTQYIQPAQM